MTLIMLTGPLKFESTISELFVVKVHLRGVCRQRSMIRAVAIHLKNHWTPYTVTIYSNGCAQTAQYQSDLALYCWHTPLEMM